MMPTDKEFAQLTDLFRSLFGLALGPEKRYLVSLRLEQVLKAHQLKTYDELLLRCQSSNSTAIRIAVIDAMTTRETSFFRDTHPFQAIETTILPELFERFAHSRKKERNKIRIWSAACSTGQEVYSLAILIDEFCRRKQTAGPVPVELHDFEIFATDISPQAIEYAKAGRYSELEIHRGLSELRKQMYFEPLGQNFVVQDRLKGISDFQTGNILQENSLSTEMDLILCRNVLIYFDEIHRIQVIERLAQSLAAGGYLILGAAEITSRFPPTLEQLSIGPTIVYRKRV